MLDALTGLPNRLHFIELLKNALEAEPRRVEVLFIDFDRFQRINRALGYSAGDALLGAAAGRLRKLLGPGDVVGRAGADEFAVMTARPIDQFIDALREPYSIGGDEIFVTASIGAAVFPDHGRDALELLGNADRAMRDAKSLGGDALRLFDPRDDAPDGDSFPLENALRRALENRE